MIYIPYVGAKDGFYIIVTIRMVTERNHGEIVTDRRDLARGLQSTWALLSDPVPRGPYDLPRPSDRIEIAQYKEMMLMHHLSSTGVLDAEISAIQAAGEIDRRR